MNCSQSIWRHSRPLDRSHWFFASIDVAYSAAIYLFDCRIRVPNHRFCSILRKCMANSCDSCSCFLAYISWNLWCWHRKFCPVVVADCICNRTYSHRDQLLSRAFCKLNKYNSFKLEPVMVNERSENTYQQETYQEHLSMCDNPRALCLGNKWGNFQHFHLVASAGIPNLNSWIC